MSDKVQAFQEEARPGLRVLDLHSEAISFDFPPVGRSPEDREARIEELEKLCLGDRDSGLSVAWVGVDGSCGKGLHSVASCVVTCRGETRKYSRSAGNASALDVELYAVSLGVRKAADLDVARIRVFSDSPGACKLALDCSDHSFQARSVEACRRIRQWFADGGEALSFHYVPSACSWGFTRRPMM